MSDNKGPIVFGTRGGKKEPNIVNDVVKTSWYRFKGTPNFKRLVVGGVTLIAVALLIGAGLLAWKLQQDKQLEQDLAAAAQAAEQAKPETVQEEAQAMAGKGDSEGAVSKLDASAAAAGSNAEKHKLLVSKAVVLVNEKDFQRALDTIAEAEKLGSSRSSSDTGAIAAEEAGQKQLAVEYYKKSLSRLDKQDPYYEFDKKNIENTIARLQQ